MTISLALTTSAGISVLNELDAKEVAYYFVRDGDRADSTVQLTSDGDAGNSYTITLFPNGLWVMELNNHDVEV